MAAKKAKKMANGGADRTEAAKKRAVAKQKATAYNVAKGLGSAARSVNMSSSPSASTRRTTAAVRLGRTALYNTESAYRGFMAGYKPGPSRTKKGAR